MRDALFDLCRRFADAHVDSSGVAVTPVPGITLVRALHPGDLQAAIARPLVAMLLQGRKSVTTGLASFDYGPGEAMVIAADVPTTSQITEASQRFPYYALVLELDLAILRELQEAGPSGPDEAPRVGIEPMNADVTDAAYRLARLFDQPGALAVLGEGLRRELHYWLLQSVHGPAIRALGADIWPGGPAARAGLRQGDVIVSVDGRPAVDAAAVSYAISSRRPGDSVKLGVRRGSSEQTLTLRAEPPPATPAKDEQVISGRNPFDGATVVNLSPAVAEELGIDPFAGRGVLVTNISRGFAMNAGLRPGDLVRRVNGREIGSVRELTGVLGGGGGQWQVTIERNGQEVTANFRT